MQIGSIPLFFASETNPTAEKPLPLEIQKICRKFKKSAGK